VMACDVPLMDLQTLQYLIQQRDTTKIATVFESPLDGFPEPLTAIWEAKSFGLLKFYHQKEHNSLRKILVDYGAKMIKAPDTGALINVNTPADAAYVRSILKKRSV